MTAKYKNVPTVVDNVRFASKKEAARYQDLKLLLAAKEISDLRAAKNDRSLKFPLVVNGELIGIYEADFRYEDKDGNDIVEDTKGFRTPVYRLKKKLMKAIYGIEIQEI